MTVHELADWLRNNQETLKASLLDGTYGPNRCVEYSFQSRKEDSVSWAFRWLSIASYSKRFCKC